MKFGRYTFSSGPLSCNPQIKFISPQKAYLGVGLHLASHVWLTVPLNSDHLHPDTVFKMPACKGVYVIFFFCSLQRISLCKMQIKLIYL